MANKRGKVEAVIGNSDIFLFLGSKITADVDCSHENRRLLLLGRKAMTHLDCVLKSRDIADKDPYSQGCGLPSSHVWLWELDHKEGRAPKNWYLQTVVLEKTAENPVDRKEIKPVNLKGDQPWIFVGRTDAEAEAPVFWSSDANSWLIGKFPDAGKDWGQKKRVSGDEMAGWYHQCNGHELGQTLGDGEGQGGLVCYSPWGRKELDTTEWLSDNSHWCLHSTYSASSIVLSILYLFTHWIFNNSMGYGFYFKDEESGAQRDSDIRPWSKMEKPVVDSKWQRWGCKFSLVSFHPLFCLPSWL